MSAHTTPAFSLGLIMRLKSILFSDEFLKRHRQSKTDFTRNRCLTFATLILFLLNLVKRSLQDELDEFFSQLKNETVLSRTVTKSAFSQARHKLKHQAFIELNQAQVSYFYQNAVAETWQGFRLLALDGSTVQLPSTPAIAAHFGQLHPAKGVPCHMARLSQVYDPLNQITLDALIAPKELGERELAAQQLQRILQLNDLLLMDRGYPAFWLFVLAMFKNARFCARMSLGIWNVVDAFHASGQTEAIVELIPTAAARRECLELGLPDKPITVRLLRIVLENGQIEILATSLLDTQRYPHAVFKELYFKRWPVEERYKTLKCRIEIENFSGKSVEAIYQDFHAKVFTMNLANILTKPAQIVIEKNNQTKDLNYQLNLTQLLSKMKYTICQLFTQTVEVVSTLIQALIDITVQTIEPIRPDRKYPRKKRVKPKKFPMCYKPTR
jgi:Transposase DDE domain